MHCGGGRANDGRWRCARGAHCRRSKRGYGDCGPGRDTGRSRRGNPPLDSRSPAPHRSVPADAAWGRVASCAGNSPPRHQSREHLPEGAGAAGSMRSSSTWGWPPTRSSRPRISMRSDSGPAARTSPRRSARGWASFRVASSSSGSPRTSSPRGFRSVAAISSCMRSRIAHGSTMLFEVVSVVQREVHIPGFGTFPFLCEVDGSLEARSERRPRLELRIIPQRGPAADIFSLGMVLASLLFHEHVGRRAPPRAGRRSKRVSSPIGQSVGPDPQPIPGRILVRRVLSRPDEHSRWFRERVEALRSYGEVTPLAEELLGIALCALLRSNHHHPYLDGPRGRRAAGLQAFRRRRSRSPSCAGWGSGGNSLTVRRWLAVARRCTNSRPLPESRSTPLLPEPISDARQRANRLSSLCWTRSAWSPRTLKESTTESLQVANLPLSQGRITQLVHHLDPILDPKGPERLAYAPVLVWSFLEWLHQPESSGERSNSSGPLEVRTA